MTPRKWPKYAGPHKLRGYAYCYWQGRKIYFGPHKHGTPESFAAYARWCRENVDADPISDAGTVAALCLAFLDHAKAKWGPRGSEYSHYRVLCEQLVLNAGDDAVTDFGPRRFAAFLRALEDTGRWNATTVRKYAGKVRRVFRWGVSRELVPASHLVALQSVDYEPGDVAPPKHVGPVSLADVAATIRHVSPAVAAMVRVQARTGMRSANLCLLQAGQIEQSGEVWRYVPASHKTAHRGKDLSIYFGPRTQRVLQPWLDRGDEYVFQPRGTNPYCQPHYRPSTYRQAILRGTKRAGVPHWHPHQLRHTVATRVRAVLGVEAAQVFLGHANASTTQLYAERSDRLAKDVAARIG